MEIICDGISGIIYVDIKNYKIKLDRSNVTGHIYCLFAVSVHFSMFAVQFENKHR